MARLPRYNLTYIFNDFNEIEILDGEVVVDRLKRPSDHSHEPLIIWDDRDDTGVRLISSPNDFGLTIYTLEGRENPYRHEYLSNMVAQIGPKPKQTEPKVVITHGLAPGSSVRSRKRSIPC